MCIYPIQVRCWCARLTRAPAPNFKFLLESVKNAAVQEVTEIAERFGRHYEGVCNALCHEQSNTRVERLNVKIQKVKTIGPGKFENFRSAILFFCGGLDLDP